MSAAAANAVFKKPSFEEFLTRYEGVCADWLMGEVEIYLVTNTIQHNEIIRFLIFVFDLYSSIKSLGRTLLAGISIYVGEELPAREPEIMIVVNEHIDLITLKFLNGPADIVIEIVSPESEARDCGTKLAEYEAANVPEYWLFDPTRGDRVVSVLHADGYYRVRPLDVQGRLTSPALPGFVVDPHTLWQETRPNGSEALAYVQQLISA